MIIPFVLFTLWLSSPCQGANNKDAQQIEASGSYLQGPGNYLIQNVATGQYLTFWRPSGGVANFSPQGSSSTVALSMLNDNTIVMSGDQSKCASAQWNSTNSNPGQPSGGYDWAAVTYTCGWAKQSWYAVAANNPAPAPAPAPSSSSSAPLASTTETVEVKTASAKKTNTVQAPSPPASTPHLPIIINNPKLAGLFKRKTKSKKATKSNNNQAQTLASSNDQQYFLIAQDHLEDMTSRAISSYTIRTAGNYLSAGLDPYDTNDSNQMWYITRQ